MAVKIVFPELRARPTCALKGENSMDGVLGRVLRIDAKHGHTRWAKGRSPYTKGTRPCLAIVSLISAEQGRLGSLGLPF